MFGLITDALCRAAERTPAAPALVHRHRVWRYDDLWRASEAVARGLGDIGVTRGDRIAVYLPKSPEAVATMAGIWRAGAVAVPVNPLLKPHQVGHILRDCGVRVLVSSAGRRGSLGPVLGQCPDLAVTVWLADGSITAKSSALPPQVAALDWEAWVAEGRGAGRGISIDVDVAAILYTSGSTGPPKGVVLSHRNLVAGAAAVAQYLALEPQDRLLAVLPLSFDAGLSQLTTAFWVGARAVLLDYLLPREVVETAAREGVTGITAVPPLWMQLAPLAWPAKALESVRFIANTGGHLPRPVVAQLRRALPRARVFLMYGLTEAFRSTYLPPEELDRRPDSMGRAIPGAEVLVVRPDGGLCEVDEPGELVHRGATVALGYWNDPARTRERFRPAHGVAEELPLGEFAVWSGDTVRRDAEGYLYFIGRGDDMIKTSGYRVSPTEVEAIAHGSGLVAAAAAVGVPHPQLGQAIVLLVVPVGGVDEKAFDPEALGEHCRRQLPSYMVPSHIIPRRELPHTPNGKGDRRRLAEEWGGHFVQREPLPSKPSRSTP
ncbi:MAG: acyl-CoA ligase (AMP-forming), exosortase A system-associated [Candidatus Competibacterales bacterium]